VDRWLVVPLRDAADEADLMEAAARVPVCTPNRAERIVAFLCSKARSIAAVGISAFQVSEVLRFRERPGAAERFEAVAASIPPGDGQVIVTERTTCVVCSKGVLVMPAGSKGKDLGASPQLFTQDGPVESCRLLAQAARTRVQVWVAAQAAQAIQGFPVRSRLTLVRGSSIFTVQTLIGGL